MYYSIRNLILLITIGFNTKFSVIYSYESYSNCGRNRKDGLRVSYVNYILIKSLKV